MRTRYGLWNTEHGSAVMGSDREDHPEQRRGVDLRRSPRHRLVLPVDLAFENETSNALVLDLSENGCLIEAERRIELGETICLHVDGRMFMAQCQMSLNVPMWREITEGCASSLLQSIQPAIDTLSVHAKV